jgi:hypothetical protein
MKRIKELFAKLGSRMSASNLSIGAHVVVFASCVVSIATSPLTWATVAQGAMAGWAVGAIISLYLIRRSLQHGDLTRRILDDYGKAVDKGLALEIENFAMKQYFRANNIEFTVTRDGDNVSAKAEYKGDDATDAVDHHAGEDRTLH